MPQLNLRETCEKMQGEINANYDMGHGDAEELFRQIWSNMTNGPNGSALQRAVELIGEAFNLD